MGWFDSPSAPRLHQIAEPGSEPEIALLRQARERIVRPARMRVDCADPDTANGATREMMARVQDAPGGTCRLPLGCACLIGPVRPHAYGDDTVTRLIPLTKFHLAAIT